MTFNGPHSPDPSNNSDSWRTASSYAQSYSEGDNKRAFRSFQSPVNKRDGKTKWFSQVKKWLSTAEPSAQAMKQQRKSAYEKHGISMNDPQAAVKMHAPIGKLPQDAITSTSGPTPEQALKQRVAKRQSREALGGFGSQYGSSGSSLRPSLRENPIAPWDV